MADLLLLHGFASSARTWRRVVVPLEAAGHRCIAYDRLGFGRAATPRGAHHYTSEAVLAEAVAVMDSHGLDQAVLMGHSGGAVVALQLALAVPDRVTSLVLIAPAVFADGPPRPVRAVFAVPGVAPVLQRLTWGRAGALVDMTVAWRPLDVGERLGEVPHPTLVITGDRDRIVPAADSLEVAARLPDASALTVCGSGHMVHIERPDEVVAATKAWIDGCPR